MSHQLDNNAVPRRWLNWKWLALGFLIATTLVLCGLQFRNTQQWSRVNRFRQAVKRAGGECHVHGLYGTDFLSFGSAREVDPLSQLSWPQVTRVILGPNADVSAVPWEDAAKVGLTGIDVDHADFDDALLATIPAETPLQQVDLRCPRITNASVDRLLRIPSDWQNYSIEHTAIEFDAALRLLQRPTAHAGLSLTTADLQRIVDLGLDGKVESFVLRETTPFSWSQLGDRPFGRSYSFFEGEFSVQAFDGAHRNLKRHHTLNVFNARLPARGLAELSAHCIELNIANSEIYGDPNHKPIDDLEQQAVTIRLWHTTLSPAALAACSRRGFKIHCEGDYTDAWLRAVDQTPGFYSIAIKSPLISDELIAELTANHRNVDRWKATDEIWERWGIPVTRMKTVAPKSKLQPSQL